MALSDTQLVVLSAACQRPHANVYPLPLKLPGGAAAKVLGALLKQELIKEVQAKHGDTVWREDKKRGRLTLRATPAAFKALGIDPAETPTEVDADDGEPAAETDTSARRPRKKGKAAKEKTPRTRADSKRAKLIEMLKRREGATIEEIVKAFDWQAHTVRGAIAGALKKKLGLNVISKKEDERGRVYRIA